MTTSEVINLVCILFAIAMFWLWARQAVATEEFKKKYITVLEQNKSVMSAYYFTALRLRIVILKHNDLFKSALEDYCGGDFEKLAQWAKSKKLKSFGVEKELDIKNVYEVDKKFKSDHDKIINQ